MNEIKGKKYYVSLGYVSKEAKKNGINAKDIKSVFMKKDKDTALYFDDSDKDNAVALPLVRVNEIQKRASKFAFRVLVDPYKIEFGDLDVVSINIIGLFSEYTKDGVQTLEHVAFFETTEKVFGKDTKYTANTTYSIEVEESKILGE